MGALTVFGLSVEDAVQKYGDVERNLDVVELWSGVGSVATAAQEAGFAEQPFDTSRVPGLTDSEGPRVTENILLESGFLRALKLTLRLRVAGLLWMAPVCSSWIFLAFSHTKRHKHDQYTGDLRRPNVRAGNDMARMAIFLYTVAFVRGVHPVLENPPSSVLFLFGPVVTGLAQIASKHTAVAPHCAFSGGPRGSRFAKKFKFVSTSVWICQLARQCRCGGRGHTSLTSIRIKDGIHRVDGCRDALKASAAYPRALGRAIIKAWSSGKNIDAALQEPIAGPMSQAAARSKVQGPRSKTGARSKVQGPRSKIQGCQYEEVLHNGFHCQALLDDPGPRGRWHGGGPAHLLFKELVEAKS